MVVTIFRNDESASLPTLLKKESTTDILIDQFDKFRNSCFEEHLWELLLKQNAYAHRRTECNDFRFQFPKFRLVRCFILSTQIYVQSAKWKSYWLTDWNEYQESTTSIGFQFHWPKLSRERCFTLPFTYARLYKEHSTREATDNFQRRAP